MKNKNTLSGGHRTGVSCCPGRRVPIYGRKGEGVSVVKDTESKIEEIEASHTLGGAGEGGVQGRGKWRRCT